MAGSMSNVEQGELVAWASSTDYTGPIGVTVKFVVKDSEVAKFQSLCKKQLDFVKSMSGMYIICSFFLGMSTYPCLSHLKFYMT